MRSRVNWALLGLVIDRPSYAYELAQRFERVYDGVLNLSSVSHVYIALSALQQRGLVEEVPGSRCGQRPKPHYRATAEGLERYRAWLVAQVGEDRQRRRQFTLALGALTADPQAALEVIDRVERWCLAEAGGSALDDHAHGAESASQLVKRLLAEEQRLAVGARLQWAQYARRELRALQQTRQG